MYVRQVTLTDFRNYTRQTADFCEGLNVIEGLNTAGKTNLVESVYMGGIGKSPRGAKDKELIRFGADCAHITLQVQKRYRAHRIDIHITQKAKSVSIDGVAIGKLADLMGVLNVVYFSPDELKIVKEDPSFRRRFINIGLCQQNQTYFKTLTEYNRILENRNALLKNAQSMAELQETLPVWNEQLAKKGAKLIVMRQEFVQTLQSIADPIHRAMAGEKGDLTLQYSEYPYTQEEHLYQYLLQKLQDSLQKEWGIRYTLVGPHRDDFAIVSEEKDLRTYGSQGQQRTAALALKLAEIAYFEKNTGEKPVLLLDDVLSELDVKRRAALLEATKGIQTLLTCTEFTENETFIGNRIHIRNGTVL